MSDDSHGIYCISGLYRLIEPKDIVVLNVGYIISNLFLLHHNMQV